MKRLISLCTVLSLLSPYAAFAAEPAPTGQEPAAQDILFKNGAKARGTVIDIVPGDHVSVRLRNGEQRRFDWVDVDRVIPASGPEPPLPPPIATAQPQPIPQPTTQTPVVVAPPKNILPPVTGPTMRVHVNSPVAAHVYRKAAGMDSSVEVCSAPCDLALPMSDEYSLAVAGGKSLNFHLSGQPGQTLNIDVDPPSDGGRIGGVLMIVAGSIGLAIGLSVDLVGLALESTVSTVGSTGGSDQSAADGTLVVGLVITGVSLALGVGGVIVFFKSGDTDYAQRIAYLDPKAAPPPIRDDRYVRTPVWHSPALNERAATSTPTFTLYSKSF